MTDEPSGGPAGPVGVVVVDKPRDLTSHDVVSILKRLYGTKAGHAGTLDPAATGVLLVGLGRATRLLSFMQSLPKAYRAEVQFGIATSTQDAEGEVTSERPCSFEGNDLSSAVQGFLGEIQQVPPMVSAVKVGGERLYKAARRGETVERKARTVRVYSLEIEDYDASRRTAVLNVECSSGTYIRTLAADLGEVLGCGAHLSSLRRTAIGSFTEQESTALEQLRSQDEPFRLARVLSPAEAMRDFPVLRVGDEDRKAVSHGRPLPATSVQREGELSVVSSPRAGQRPAHEAGMSAGIPISVIDESGELIAVYRKSSGELRPAMVLS